MPPLSAATKPWPSRSQRASALVTTLLVITVLTIIVVAFLQSMSIERMTSRSYANMERARLAAEAGVNAAQAMLASGIGTNFGYATILTNFGSVTNAPFTLIVSGANRDRMMPLVSGPFTDLMPSGATNDAQLAAYLSNSIDTNAARSFNLNTKMGYSSLNAENGKIIPHYFITDEPNAPRFGAAWTYVTNASGQTNSRFAFFVVDEQGKLNLAVHGGTNATNRVGWDQLPSSIPIGISGNESFVSSNNGTLTFPREQLLSYAQIARPFTNRLDYEKKKHLYTYHFIPSIEVIPAGSFSTNTNTTFRAYPNAHEPKFNINDLATNSIHGGNATMRAVNLAQIINTNLIGFKTRDQAFVEDGKSASQIRYVERIAASIIDYIDGDTTTTLLEDGEPAGKELAPVITSIAEKYNWISESGSGSLWTNQIKHTAYVQLWNPYQTNVSGSIDFELFTPNESGRFRFIEMPGAIQQPMDDLRGTSTVTLRPNEFKVYEVGAVTNTVISSVQGSTNVANHPRLPQTGSTNTALPLHTRFRASWNGTLFDKSPNDSSFYDRRGPGLQKDEVGGSAATRISLNGTSRFSINYPQVVSVSPKGFRGVGDPRQNYLANYVWATLAQGNADVRWNGRNNNNASVSQNLETTFAQRDTVRANPRLGVNTGNNDPTTAPVVWQASDAANAIGFIRNAPMASIGELGNIYDPVHLNDVGFATSAGNPDSWYASGGGRTLRIGQPEFLYPTTNAAITPSSTERRAATWNVDDRRAVSLLDIFTATPADTNGISSTLGKVNLNTAPRGVLAALFSGIGQNADPVFSSSRMTSNASFALADTVISNRPYFRLGDVHKFSTNLLASTNYSPALGAVSTNVAVIMDAGREQILGGLLQSIDVRSQAYQVFVIGESLDSRGRPTSRSLMRALLEVQINRASPTNSLNLIVRPVYVQYH